MAVPQKRSGSQDAVIEILRAILVGSPQDDTFAVFCDGDEFVAWATWRTASEGGPYKFLRTMRNRGSERLAFAEPRAREWACGGGGRCEEDLVVRVEP
jgi:hypothetical protein